MACPCRPCARPSSRRGRWPRSGPPASRPSSPARPAVPPMLQASAYSATRRRVTLGPRATDEDGQVRLDRRGQVEHRTGAIAPVRRRPLTIEHAAHDRQRISQPAQPLAGALPELQAEGFVLGLEPGSTDAQHRAAAADVVERGDHLGHQRRIAEGVGADHHADAGALGHRRHGRHGGVALEDRAPRAIRRWDRGGPKSRWSRSRGDRPAAGPPGTTPSRCTGSSS